MKIFVNGAPHDSASGTLAALLEELGQAEAKIATSVNEAFVPKTMRAQQVIQDGDRVEIVSPRQGG